MKYPSDFIAISSTTSIYVLHFQFIIRYIVTVINRAVFININSPSSYLSETIWLRLLGTINHLVKPFVKDR
jgi:hypothetical protein